MHILDGRDFDGVLRILQSDSHSLKSLAYISGFEPFSFYRGADLTGLDLSDQDLTGLNFDGADLRGARLPQKCFDVGAFNNSKLSPECLSYQDEYDCYLSDTLDDNSKRLYLFGKIRGIDLEACIVILNMPYHVFAGRAHLSTATLRKARKSQIVSFETLTSIASVIDEYSKDLAGQRAIHRHASFRQPMVSLAAVNTKGGFTRVTRTEYLRLLNISRYVYERRKSQGQNMDYLWRDSPEMLEWYGGRFEHLLGIEVEDDR